MAPASPIRLKESHPHMPRVSRSVWQDTSVGTDPLLQSQLGALGSAMDDLMIADDPAAPWTDFGARPSRPRPPGVVTGENERASPSGDHLLRDGAGDALLGRLLGAGVVGTDKEKDDLIAQLQTELADCRAERNAARDELAGFVKEAAADKACPHCEESRAGLRKLALALCELAARFVWLSGLREDQRLSLAKLVLECSLPCASLDIGVEKMCAQLERSIRSWAGLPWEQEELNARAKEAEEDWKRGWAIGADPRLWYGVGVSLDKEFPARAAPDDASCKASPISVQNKRAQAEDAQRLKELEELLAPKRRSLSEIGDNRMSSPGTSPIEARSVAEMLREAKAARTAVARSRRAAEEKDKQLEAGNWVLVGSGGKQKPGPDGFPSEPINLFGDLKLDSP